MNTYMKLHNGGWGVRLDSTAARAGERVLVTRKDGSTHHRTIERVLFVGDGFAIASLVDEDGPAPATTAAPLAAGRVADCRITHTDESVTVLSPRGNTVTVIATDYDNNWDAFSGDESRLLDRLFAVPSGGRCVLTAADMSLFLAMAQRAGNGPESAPMAPVDCVAVVPSVAPVEAAPAPQTKHATSPAQDSAKEANRRTVARTAQHHVAHSFGRGVDAIERQVEAYREAIRTISETSYVMLSYDISDRAKAQIRERNDLPGIIRSLACEPTRLLNLLGFPFNESVFCVRQDGLELPITQAIIGVWLEYRLPVRTMDVPESAKEQMRQWCVEELDKRLRDLHTSLIQGIANASDELAKAQAALPPEATANERDEVQRKADNAMRSRLKTAAENLHKAICAAEAFDVSDNLADLIAGYRAAILAQTQAFNAQMVGGRGKTVELP